MIRTDEISATRPDPVRPGQKLPVGPTNPRPFGERGPVAAWLGSLCRPTASLREAGRPPLSDEARAAMLADQRVVMGPRRRGGR